MTESEAIKELKQNIEMPFGSNISNEVSKLAIKALEEIQKYQAIGTVEECREARERQKEKKPVCRSIFTDRTRFPGCPTCFSRIDRGAFYCSGCGQKLDWH